MTQGQQAPQKRNSVLEKQQRFFLLASVTGAAAIGAVILLTILVLNRFAGAQQPDQLMILKPNVQVKTETIKTIPDDIAVGIKASGPGENDLQGNLMEPDTVGDTMDRFTDNMEAGSAMKMPESSYSDHMPDVNPSRSPTSANGSLPASGAKKWGGPSEVGSGGGASTGHGIRGGAGNMGQGLGALAGDRDILLIWVLDSSASMFDKIEQMKQEITTLFKSYDRKMTMSVISFDNKPISIISKPTNQVQKVIAAFDKVKADGKKKQIDHINYYFKNKKVHPDAGVENTMKAIQYAAKTHSNPRRKVVIALMTDEVGNDSNEGNTNNTLSALKRGKIAFFVFGPQSNMRNSIFTQTTMVSDPSFPKEIAPTGTVRILSRADHGSALPIKEPLAYHRSIFSARRGGNSGQPYFSGLGPYYLSRLVEATGGKYYFFEGSSNAMSQFKPIYDSRHKNYNNMVKALNDLRKNVNEWESRQSLPATFSSQARFDGAKIIAHTNLALAEKIISRLQNYKPGEEDTIRINAHRQLCLTELYAARFRLMEYIAALNDTKKLRYETTQSGNTVTTYLGRITESPVTGMSGMLKNAAVDFPTQKQMRLVIRSQAEWQEAIKKHSALRMLQDKPRVNFNNEMIIVVSAGIQYHPDAHTDIITTFEIDGKLMVVTDQELPRASRHNIDKPYFPNSVLVVAKFSGKVEFITVSEWAESNKSIFGNSIKGGSKSAKALIQTRIARARIGQKYPNTAWSKITAQISLGSFRCEQTRRETVILPKTPQPIPQPRPQPRPPVTPTIPGGG